jgi:hypothetical protein
MGWGSVRSWSARHWRFAAHTVRALWQVGIPCVILWRGALIAQFGIPTTYAPAGAAALALQLFGLGEASSLLVLGRGTALAAVALGLLIVLWVWYARTLPGTRMAAGALSWWGALGDAASAQILWAFYRGVAALYTSERLPIVLISLILTAAPWFTDLRRRNDLLHGRGHLVVQDWVCALFTAVLSLSVDVLWLLILAHALWLWVGERALARSLSTASLRAPTAEGGPV